MSANIVAKRLRRCIETLKPYAGHPSGAPGSAARQQQDDQIAAYADAMAIANEIDMLSDPVAVHRNMLAGAVAKPSCEHILHLYPDLRDAIEATEREACALVAEQPDRRGRDFVPGSLWDNLCGEIAARIRARTTR